jgi:hypothetical protein
MTGGRGKGMREIATGARERESDRFATALCVENRADRTCNGYQYARDRMMSITLVRLADFLSLAHGGANLKGSAVSQDPLASLRSLPIP